MRKSLLLLLVLLISRITFADNVTTNSGSGLAATYPTLAAAITALNSAAINSPVVITLNAPETAPVGGYLITKSGDAINTITIDGNNNTITAYTPQSAGIKSDAFFKIGGADYITIQNFTMQENAGNNNYTLGSNTMTEFGVLICNVSATDGAQYCTIKNNTITLDGNYQNSTGIYSSTRNNVSGTSLDATSTAGLNNYLKIYGNIITGVAYGIACNSPGNTANIGDAGVEIGGASAGQGNTITYGNNTPGNLNWASYVSASYGICYKNGVNFSIRNNKVTSISGMTIVTTGIMYTQSTAPSITYTNTISNNNITITNTSTTQIIGIDFGYGNSSGTILADNNTILLNQTAATTSVPYGISAKYVSAATTLTNNNITINQTSTTAAVTGINAAAAVTNTRNCSNNTITINQTALAATNTAAVTGIDATSGAATNTASSNTITINQTVTTGGIVSSLLTGIDLKATITTAINALSNTILFNQTTSSATALSSAIVGINATTACPTVNINTNTITVKQAITGSGLYGSAAVTFINAGAAHATLNILNNTLNTSGSNIKSTGTITGISHDASITSALNINSNIMNIDATGTTATVQGIYGGATTPQTVLNYNINGNNITMSSNGANPFIGIYNSDGATGLVKTINSNTITLTGSSNQPMGMKLVKGSFNVGAAGLGNTITMNMTTTQIIYGLYCSCDITGSMLNNSLNLTGASSVTGIYCNNSTTGTINYNNITLASSMLSPTIYGIDCEKATSTYTANNNIINSITASAASTSGYIIDGILLKGATNTIANNTIHDITTGAGTGTATINGIEVTVGTTINVNNNKIYNINTACTGTSSFISAIKLLGGNTSVYNNIIGLTGTFGFSSNEAIRGINFTNSTASTNLNAYYNTIYINATSTGTNFGTTGIYHQTNATATTAALDLQDNIIVNTSTANGTGLTVAYRRSNGNVFGNYVGTSNKNLFYAGTAGPKNLIFSDGTNASQTLVAYQGISGLLSPSARDANSISLNPAWQSTTGSDAGFLHIASPGTGIAGAGSFKMSSPYDVDFDGDNRKATTDIGADEFSATPPTLTGASGVTVDDPFTITISDGTWGSKITGVKYGSNTLTTPADYTISGGNLTLKPAGSVTSGLRTAGTQNITVSASGYLDTSFSQTIGAGTDKKLVITTQPSAPGTNGGLLGAPQPVVAIQDQYGNQTTSTATIVAGKGAGSWIIGGTTSIAAVNGVATFTDLTATSDAALDGATIIFTSGTLTSVTSTATGFTIPTPGSVPTKLAIASFSNPTAGIGFNVTIESRDASNYVSNVSSDTEFSLTSNGNAGTLAGTTLTGTIPAGSHTATLTVTLPNPAIGVTLTATQTSNSLTAGTSASFSVLPTQVSGLNVAGITPISMNLSWTNGNGSNRIVVARLSTTTAVSPTLGTGYTSYSTSFVDGTNSTTGTGNIVVYNGNGNSLTITGLSPSTTYNFDVYEYNGATSTSNYAAKVSLGATATLALYTPTLTFTTPTSVTKKNTDAAFTNAATTNSNGTITYGSSNTAVATVNSAGLITIVAATGTTTITANLAATSTYNSGTTSFLLTVYTPALATLTVSPATATINPGATQQLTVSAVDQKGNAFTLTNTTTWSVGTGASIDATGLFSSSTKGVYTVTATNTSIQGTAKIDILPTNTNLSIGATATALSVSTQNPGNTAPQAIDNSLLSRWESLSADPQWIIVDLGSMKYVTDIVIRWETASAQNYIIEASTDNTNWTTKITKSTMPAGANRVDGMYDVNFQARYVRMSGSTRTTGYGYSILEFQIFGTLLLPNLTFATPTSVSKNYGDDTFQNAASSSSAGAITYISGNTNVATVNSSGVVTILSAGSAVITANIAATGTYTSGMATYTLTVNPKALASVASAAAGNKVYDGTTSAVISGTFPDKVGSDAVNLVGNFDNASIGTGKSVTATTTLAGAQAANYTFTGTLPTGLTADILPATLTSSTGTTVTLSSSGLSDLQLAGTDVVVISGELVINQSPSTVHSVTVNPGAKLTLNSGQTLTTPVLNLNSDINGTATYVDNGTTTVTNANVQQYLATTRNWYISSPISNAVAPSGYTYYQRDEAGASWISVPFTAGNTFVPGKGYIALPGSADGVITFSTANGGHLNTGDVPVTLSFSGSTSKGYNLIGNPYPSNLTWTKKFVDNNASLIEPSIYYRTTTGTANNQTGWSFKTINASTGEASPSETTNIIPPMQAFWVIAKAAGTLTLNSDLTRSHESSNPLKAPAVTNSIRQRLRLQVDNGVSTDETLIYFDGAASNDFDSYDSPKMSNNSASIPEIYTLAGKEQLVINGLNSIAPTDEMPLGFTTGQAGSFAIKASEVSNFDADAQIILKDKLLNRQQELTPTSGYSFTSEVSSNANRFSLIFKSGVNISGINELENNQNVSVYKNANNQIMVNCSSDITGESTATVYNAVGIKLATKQLSGTITIFDRQFVSGVYLVTVTTSGKSVTKKVILN